MAAAAAPAQDNVAPSTPPANGRYRTGDDIDPMKDERSGLIREVGCQAIWSLSSCKPGFGVDQLRDQSLDNYWQSDGQLPHLVNIQFRRKMTIRDICIYTDFKLDESYTPSKISIRCGTHFNDLQEVELVEFSEPSGWVQIFLKDIRDRPIRTFMLQLAVLSNHQNGRDTHLRQIRIHSPVDNLPVAVFPDVSIWLHQLVKGFKDKDGNPLQNAHLLGVFHRLCKLLNYGIKPVFVFDGGVPALKRQTLAARRQRKIDSLDKAELSRQKILSAYLQQQLQRASKQALPPSLRMQAKISKASSGVNKSPGVSPKKLPTSTQGRRGDNEVDEDLAEFQAALIAKLEEDVDHVDRNGAISESDTDGESDSAHGYHYGVDYSENFSVIQAPDFDTLPLETQHEILFEMQESRKMNSWGKFDKMPKDLQSFSNFQMDRLVKRRTLQKKIQSVQQEMGQRHIHVQNLDDLLKMDYNFEGKDTKIVGSKADGFVLVKSQPEKAPGCNKNEPKPGPSASTIGSKIEVITIDDFIEDSSSDEGGDKVFKAAEPLSPHIIEDEDEDLKLAIQLSLQEANTASAGTTSMYSSQDNLQISDETGTPKNININMENIHSKIAYDDPATTETNCENLKSNPLENFQPTQLNHCAKFLDTIGFQVPSTNKPVAAQMKPPSSLPVETRDVVGMQKGESPSESEDDDFEEVCPIESTAEKSFPTAAGTSSNTLGKVDTVVTLDLNSVKKFAPEDDLFADVFGTSVTHERVQTGNEARTTLRENAPVVHKNYENDSAANCSDPRPSFEPMDASWESDDEFETDLLNMVVESTANFQHTVSMEGKSDVKGNDETSSKLSLQYQEAEQDKPMDNNPKMITAEYMQAQEKLNSNLERLQSERGLQERVATSISDQMQVETQELVALFGIPYVISPTEAESQCAFLDRACLTEGTITDDSDVWLFGGQRVYKNFFSQGQRPTEFYQAADIHRVLNLDRERLIVLAILIGCDYSEGVQGVGPVLALELLSEFSSAEVENFEILVKFREWWDEILTKSQDTFAGSKVKEKLRKLKLRPGFPSKAVYDAFMDPTIDTSTEPFKWGNPDLDAIRTYTKSKFGWDQSKCDSMLLPVLKKRCDSDQSKQMTLDAFITFGKIPTLEGGKRKKGSKRLQTAVKKLRRIGGESHDLNLSSDSDVEEKGQQPPARKAVTKGRQKKVSTTTRRKSTGTGDPVLQVNVPSSSRTDSSEVVRPVPVPKPPKPEVIPQKVQEESDKLRRKQKAIEIFKKQKT